MSETKSGNSGGAWGAAFLAFVVVLLGATVAIAIWGTESEPDGALPPTGATETAPGFVASASGAWVTSRTPSPSRSRAAGVWA